ncbi:MAG: 30S ribosomal protein S5 [Candidatus Aenigmarchaeota archaeon]|nr:30S ribosomal protein S5 [Candidatus Aenigmarchaeota archaeon]
MEKHKEEKVLATEVKNELEVPKELPIEPEEIKEPIIEETRRDIDWTPKTVLGKQVFEGKITSVEQILTSGKKILEPKIVEYLIPDLKTELILIGGRGGKGGGAQRIPIRITAKMHSSGRRFRTSSLIAVGNGNGLIGIGRASSVEPRTAMEKATNKAKLNIMMINRGCGDWECGCGTNHSILFKTKGKSGSVHVQILPAPKGVGLVADNETKKLLRLAGIKDAWSRTSGNTGNRINLISAVADALKKLYIYEK